MGKKYLKKAIAAVMIPAMLLSSGSLTALAVPAEESGSFQESLEVRYKNPDQKFQTETRWWLAEGAHTDETIVEEIKTMHEQGFSGFELCMLNEGKLDSNIYAYGSEEWSHDVKLAIETASELGMSVSLTSGTNWSTANISGLDPNSEAAGQEVGYSVEKVASGQSRNGALETPKNRAKGIEVKRKLIGVYAYRVDDAGTESAEDPTEINKDSVIDLTARVGGESGNETLDWTAPDDGDYILYSMWQQGTFQTSAPAQKTAYAINYFDKAGTEGIINYLENYIFADQELVDVIKKSDVQFFMDSLEISTTNGDAMFWSHDMADEFQARKGYDIRPYLPLLIGSTTRVDMKYADMMGKYVLSDGDGEDGEALTKKIRNDMFDVHTQLIQEEMMQPLKKWANEKYGIKLRAQISYGSWIEISEMGMSVDYPETETLNQKDQLDIFRLWSGIGHIQNQMLSTETGAIGNMNYALSEQDYLRMSYIQFSAGINRIIWHGHSSSWGPEASISWPGYEGMWSFISGRFDAREPNSKDYAEMNDHMGRVQQVLREGVSQTDLGILHLKYGESMPFNPSFYNYMNEHEGIYWKDITLQDAGYTYDYFSPAYLTKMEYDPATGTLGDTAGYQAIMLNQDELPAEYAKVLLGFAKQGLKVVIVDGAGTVTPYNDGRDEELSKVMAELKSQDNVITVSSEAEAYDALQSLAVRPRAELVGSNAQILTQLRRDGDDLYLYAYNYCNDQYCGLNHGLNATTEISMDGRFVPYAINSWTGDVEKVADYRYEDGRTIFTVSLDYNDVALYAFEHVDSEELHAVSTNAQKIVNKDGKLAARAAKSGTYTTALSNGSTYSCELTVPKAKELTGWDITVEDWTQGDKSYRSEVRDTTVYDPETDKQVQKKVETVEAKYETKKDTIYVRRKYLATWDKIPQIGKAVSGIGYYHTTFDWDSEAADGAYLDLGKFPQSAVVMVNGKKADAVNVMNAVIDITDLLKNGENELDITVTSTLTNRLLDMGRLRERSAGYNDYYCGYFSNGLSSVTLIPYAEAVLGEENKEFSSETRMLKDIVQIYTDLNTDGFTAESVKSFKNALTAAQNALENDVSDAEKQKAMLELVNAVSALKIDTNDLEKAAASALDAAAKAQQMAVKALAEAAENKNAAEIARKAADAAQLAVENVKKAAAEANKKEIADLTQQVKEAQKAAEAAQKAADDARQELENTKFASRKPVLKKTVSPKKKTAKVSWKKVPGADGYVIQYSTKSNFKGRITASVKKRNTLSRTVKRLKSGKKYYFRVKAYKTVDGKKIFTNYSARKYVRVK